MKHIIYINDYEGFDWFRDKVMSLNSEYKKSNIDLIRYDYYHGYLDTTDVIAINPNSGNQYQYNLSMSKYVIGISLFVVSEKFAEYPEIGISHDHIGMEKVCSDLFKCGVKPDQIVRESIFFRDIMGITNEVPKPNRFELLDI